MKNDRVPLEFVASNPARLESVTAGPSKGSPSNEIIVVTVFVDYILVRGPRKTLSSSSLQAFDHGCALLGRQWRIQSELTTGHVFATSNSP